MKTNLKFIGIDVSKDTLAICVLSQVGSSSYVIANNSKAIFDFFQKQLTQSYAYHIGLENTGKYGWALVNILAKLPCCFYMINPLDLHKSLGLIRGTDDKTAAMRIAQFIKKNYDQLSSYQPARQPVASVQLLLAERNYKVKQRSQLKAKNKELQVIDPDELIKNLIDQNKALIQQLDRQIRELQTQIKSIIKADKQLKSLEKQLKSVPGVGDILCWTILVKTNEFKAIKEPRKLACYAGVVPFSKRSGTCVFSKSRVSVYADKSMKKLLHLAAMSAIRLENDLSAYYKRKVQEGKNKMSALNAVRNKIIHIIFALVKNQTFFQNRLVVS